MRLLANALNAGMKWNWLWKMQISESVVSGVVDCFSASAGTSAKGAGDAEPGPRPKVYVDEKGKFIRINDSFRHGSQEK